jgi:hypothetical protein
MANGARAPVNGRSWTVHANAERSKISRMHPLTLEGEEIGAFELSLSCDDAGSDYTVAYVERRRGSQAGRLPAAPTAVEITLAGKSVPLKVVSAKASGRPLEIEAVAHGRLSADVLKAFAEGRGRSLTVETASKDITTTIRVGNAGLAHALPQLLASCSGRPPIRNTARNEVRQGG